MKDANGYALTNILVLRGSNFDLTKFDYSPFGVSCLDIESPAFDAFLLKNFKELNGGHRHKDHFNEILKNKHPGIDEHFYVFHSTDLCSSMSEGQILWVYKALLLLFPSSLQPHTIFGCQILEDCRLWECASTEFYLRNFDHYLENILVAIDERIPDVNNSLKITHDRIKEIRYSNTALGFYLASYQTQEPYLEYVNLVICLEILVEGQEQLTFRLKRNLAVLCGMDILGSRNIFSNVGKIYDLRSKIVHQGEIDYLRIQRYLPYLRSLVSVMILEVLNHNIKSLKELNDKLNVSSFGSKENISPGYIQLIPDTSSYVRVNTTILV